MKVTVTQGNNVATFNWNEAADDCTYTAIGFEDAQVDQIIAAKAHMGQQVEGYAVEVDF